LENIRTRAQRLIRADEKRVQNLSQLANKINNQCNQHDKQLPERLSDAQKTKYADPVTGKPPEYTTKPSSSYMLCTPFATGIRRKNSREPLTSGPTRRDPSVSNSMPATQFRKLLIFSTID